MHKIRNKFNSISPFLRKYYPFFAILTVTLAVFSIKYSLAHGTNELDVLPSAKHFMDPSWIPNDWYLSQNIGYRMLFDVLFGGAALFMPLLAASIFFKLIIHILFAYVVTRLLRHLNMHPLLVIPFIFVFCFNQGFSSGEWMLGGVETKSFAYICVLASLEAFLEKSYRRMFFLSGLAVSFHILIGFYACVCLLTAFIFRINDYKKDIFAMLSSSYLFFISSVPAIFSFVQYIQENKGVDSVLAALIYVLYRVPHHTIPDMFLPMWYLKFIAFIVFFVLLYFFSRDYKKKTIAGYAIGSIMLYCTGIIIYYAGMIPFLKFYWFRFADTVLPFLFYITVAVMLSDFIRSEIVKRTKIIRVAVFVMGITASLAGVIYTGSDFTANLRKIISSGKPLFLSSLDIDIQKTQQWIKNNTPSGAIFLVNPSWTYFYYLAERPMIVSFKHSPQSDKKIIEWFDRMTMIIGKDHDPKKLARFPFKRTAMKGYSELTEERVRAIHEKFPFKFYIAENKNRMPYQKVFAQGKYTIYKIE